MVMVCDCFDGNGVCCWYTVHCYGRKGDMNVVSAVRMLHVVSGANRFTTNLFRRVPPRSLPACLANRRKWSAIHANGWMDGWMDG